MDATKALIILAFTKLLLSSAKSGNAACPSCEMELASRTEKGTTPVAKRVTNSKCGPDSGMSPIKTAKAIIHNMLSLINSSMWK